MATHTIAPPATASAQDRRAARAPAGAGGSPAGAGRPRRAASRGRRAPAGWQVPVVALLAALGGCSYVGTVLTQADYSLRQLAPSEQRVYKHMLDRDTFYVFGRLGRVAGTNPAALAVIAVSDRFRPGEVVDVSHNVRPESYYGLNLPAGDYRLLVVGDLDRSGFYDEAEVIGARALALSVESVPDKVLGGYDLDPLSPPAERLPRLRVDVPAVPARAESLFFPQGTLRSLDDPVFSPQVARLGMYAPAAFLEAAPNLFYALEEDLGYKIPIVFVHGIDGSARDFEAVVAGLDRRRFKPWFFHYPSGAGIKQLGAAFYKIFLSGKVIPLGEIPVVIVAHSMGGLVAREAMNLRDGGPGENRVQRLITVASPLGGYPGARSAASAPVVIPSWRDLHPEGEFVAGLHRTGLPATTEYHLLFAYGDDRAIKVGSNSDGVVPLASQLSPRAQKEARAQYGFDDTHAGILRNPAAIETIVRIAAEVRSPLPEDQMRELHRGGYDVELGATYTPLEAFLIRNLGHYLAAMAAGTLTPVHPSQEHFVRVIRGQAKPEHEAETAWLKFTRDCPDRQWLPQCPPRPPSGS